MFVVDTNVLIYAADPDSEFHEVYRRQLQHWHQQPSPWYLTWPICYEFLRVSSHPRVFRRPWTLAVGWRFLETIFDSPAASILLSTSRHATILCQVLAEIPGLRGNILHDAHTAVLMREHGIKEIYTRDMDFHRFPFIKVLDPAKE